MKKHPLFAALAAVLLVPLAARADFIDLWANKSPSEMGARKEPALGHSKVLLIPVQINYGTNPPLDLPRLKQFFTEDRSDAFRFRSFFRLASLGRFQVDVDVMDPIIYDGCPTSLAGQAGCTIARGDISALQAGMDFVRDIFRRAKYERKIDFSAYDINGLEGGPDGFIDGVMIVVNVPTGIAFPIWDLNSVTCSFTDPANPSALDPHLCTGGPFEFDHVKIPAVAIGGINYPDGQPHSEYIVAHEFSHLLGAADLYYEHPNSEDPYPNFQGLHFSTMGDWNYDETAILHDAETRRALGWADVHVVSGTETLTLLPAAAGGQVVKLGMLTPQHKEYFLVEARAAHAHVDNLTTAAGTPTAGLAVYHVDWSQGPLARDGSFIDRLLHCLDCDPYHPFIQNLEPDGRFSFVTAGVQPDDVMLFRDGATVGPSLGAPPLSKDNKEFNSNYYDGTVSGITITNVHVDDATGSVTATFTAPSVADPCSDLVSPSPISCEPGLTCIDGSCVVPGEGGLADGGLPLPPGKSDGGTGDAPSGKPCGCSGDATPGLGALGLLLALGLRRRRAA